MGFVAAPSFPALSSSPPLCPPCTHRPRCAPVALLQMTTTLEPYQILWTTVSQFYDKYSLWMNGPFIKLNPEEVEADTNEAFRCGLGWGQQNSWRGGNEAAAVAAQGHAHAWGKEAGGLDKVFVRVFVETAVGRGGRQQGLSWQERRLTGAAQGDGHCPGPCLPSPPLAAVPCA